MKLPQIEDFYSPDDVGRFRRNGYWTDETAPGLLDAWADERPDDVFVHSSAGDLTVGDFRGQAWRLAAALRDLGVDRHDRVIVQAPNWPETLVALMGATCAGAILVPALPSYRLADLRHLASNTGAVLSIVAGSVRGTDLGTLHRGLVEEEECSLGQLVVMRGSSATTGASEHRFEDLSRPDLGAALPDTELPTPLGPDDGHIIIHTSGTESKPKGCFHTFNTMGFTMRTIQRVHGWSSADVAVGPTPVVHSNGYVNHYLVPLRTRARTALMEHWDPAGAVELIESARCTTTVTATTFLTTLLDAQRERGGDLTSMRVWVASGTTVPPAVIEEARGAMPSCEFLSQYGRSENQLTTSCVVGNDPVKSVTSDGIAPDGIEIALFDHDGRPAGDGPGDVGYRGPGHMLGYVNQPELTAAMVNEAGYSLAGDLAQLDADGYLRITGRIKDIIIRGGVNISAREVEDALLTHPDVHEVAAVGMPDDRLGERVCVFVVPEPSTKPSLAELCSYLRDRLDFAMQKLPERLELVDELPVNATGKVQKNDLRARVKDVLRP